MSDRPWLAENAPGLRVERELLRELGAQEPPPGSVDRGWAALVAELPLTKAAATVGVAAGTAATASHASGQILSWGLAAKVAVGVVVAGGALWGASALSGGESASNPAVRPSVVAPPPEPRVAPAPVELVAPSVPPAEAEAPKSPEPSQARRAASVTTLAEEGRLLAKAHQLVQAGQAGEALKVLRSLDARFPRSVLAQEREVLTIEALGATGADAAARSKAQRFLARYPNSPHAARLGRFVK